MDLLFTECSDPPSRNGLALNGSLQLIEDSWVEGDNISYSCTGDGVTDDDVISVCRDDGQWSLQTLPVCCKQFKFFKQIAISMLYCTSLFHSYDSID